MSIPTFHNLDFFLYDLPTFGRNGLSNISEYIQWEINVFSGITCLDESLTTRPGTCIKQIICRLLPALKQRRIVWRTNIQVRRKKLGQACSDPTASSHLTAAELINCTITTALTHYWPPEGQNSFTISTLETHWDGHLRRRRTYIVQSPWQLKKKTILAVS